MKLHFLFATPILKSYMKRYGINYLEKMGYEIALLDFSPVLNPRAFEKITTGLIREQDYTRIHSKLEFKTYISFVPKDSFFIFAFDFGVNNYFIYRYLKGFHYGYMNRMNTNVEIQKIATSRLNNYVKKISIQRLKQSVFTRIPLCCFPISGADFILLGGKANAGRYINSCMHRKNTKVYYLQSSDYDEYLSCQEGKKDYYEKYCVFLDQYIPYHSDDINSIDAVIYYKQLMRYFKYIEEKLGTEVVIAAHPRSSDQINAERFKGHRLVRFGTCGLVKNAEFVLAHFSTSINYAVLYRKPVILLTLDEFTEKTDYSIYIEKYAELLGVTIINLSDEKRWKAKLPSVEIKKYEEFIVQYLKADYDGKTDQSEQKQSCEKMYEILSKLES